MCLQGPPESPWPGKPGGRFIAKSAGFAEGKARRATSRHGERAAIYCLLAMALYRKFILPHLINFVMGRKDLARCRSEIVSQAHGEILEIGIGSGLNLPFYSSRVTKVRGVDPSSELLQMASRRAGFLPVPLELLNASAEELPLGDQTVDSVVMTWSLCSIPDPNKALREMRRVLKPGGDLFFVEHGLSPEPQIKTWQERINPPWRALAGGCNLNREIDRLISSAGFRIRQLDKSYLPGPRVFSFTYRGRAQRVP